MRPAWRMRAHDAEQKRAVGGKDRRGAEAVVHAAPPAGPNARQAAKLA